MARKKKAPNTGETTENAHPTEAATTTTDVGLATITSEHNTHDTGPRPGAGNVEAERHERSTTTTDGSAISHAFSADPRPVLTVNLCGYSGGPMAHLQRSYRFKQMQIRFDQGQPDEPYLTMLKRAGWLDRTESEGVWTKQIDQNARWQAVDRMEQEFRSVTNAIRKDRGLAPVLQSPALA